MKDKGPAWFDPNSVSIDGEYFLPKAEPGQDDDSEDTSEDGSSKVQKKNPSKIDQWLNKADKFLTDFGF